MTTRTPRNLTVLAALLALLVPASALAQSSPRQQRPERPYRGLFGSSYGDTAQQLVLNLSFGGGWDDDLLADSFGGGPGVPPPQLSGRAGGFGLGTASLNYNASRERWDASAFVGTTGRYYPDLENEYLGSHGAGVQATLRLTSRTTLSASQQFAYQPYNVLVLVPIPISGDLNPGEPLDFGLATNRRQYQQWRTAVDLSQQFTQRWSGAVLYSRVRTDADRFGEADQEWDSIGGRLSYQIARGLSARAGYSTGTARLGASEDGEYRRGTIDAGVDLDRALSISRRTRVSFSTGVSGIDDGVTTRYYFVGGATLTREIGRSWSAALAYRRSADFFERFTAPLTTHSVTADVGGLIGRRLQLNFSGGAVDGRVGLATDSPEFTTGYAGARLRIGLTRLLALDTGYTYYRYRFDEGATLPAGMTPRMDRQSVTASLTFRLPLYERTRRPDASR